MKITTTPLVSVVLFCAFAFSQASFAGSSLEPGSTAEREVRTQQIEALQRIIRNDRISRSKRVQAKLDLARLQAETRKDRRNGR